MTHNIQILSYIRGSREIVTVPVSRAVQIKVDNMAQQHNLHIVLRAAVNDRIEVGIWSQGHQLTQRFCDFNNEAIISAVSDEANFADVPKLLKLLVIDMEASIVVSGTIQ